MHTIAYKERGESNFGDFCAYLLCGWPLGDQESYLHVFKGLYYI